MTDQEIFEQVKNILGAEFEVEASDVTPGSALYDELGLDSLDSVDLVVALEKQFGFRVVRSADEEKIRVMRMVSDVCEFIKYKTRQGA